MEAIIPRLVLLILLFLLVIYRMIATVFPDMNIILYICEPPKDIFGYVCHGEIKFKDVACVAIWILVTSISTLLVLDIIMNGLGQSAFKGFHRILSLLSIISYEIWMFTYLYHTYATNLDWHFEAIILLPLVTLIGHSIFQNFLSYNEYVLPNNEKRMKDLVYYILTSMGFNGIMLVHVLFMFVTALSTGISNEKYIVNVVFLGISEMMYRAHVMKNHFEQLKNQYIPYTMYMRTALEYHMQQLRNNIHNRAELESVRINLDVHVELVTGLTQNRNTSYLTGPIAATAVVAVFSAFVAGNM